VGIDRPETPEDPAQPPDRPGDHQDGHGGHGRAARGSGPAETRPRQECWDTLRMAEAAEKAVTAQQAVAREREAGQKWDADAKEFRWMWGEYQRKWPPADHAPASKPDDPAGSWRNGDRFLSPAQNDQVEAECRRVAERERDKISPAMLAIESQDPYRHLTGFDHRLKGQDRIKEKVHRSIRNFGRSPEEAVSRVPDTIRYTFGYQEARYTQGVLTDILRLKDQGFKLVKLRNSWSDDQYKGINSQWIEPDTGQRFEVQFHTYISFEAKQLTHDAYERIRAPRPYKPDKFEQMVLEAFQKKVTAEVPVPLGAEGIPDYPKRGPDAR
jgi:hypothetical protein